MKSNIKLNKLLLKYTFEIIITTMFFHCLTEINCRNISKFDICDMARNL